MHRAPSSRNHRGFSLLEVLVAVVIMSVGLLALASLQLSLIRSSSDTKSQSFAMGLAKEKLERLKAYQATGGADSTCISPSAGTANTCYRAITTEITETPTTISLGGVAFTRTTEVTRYAFNKATGLYATPTVTNFTTALDTAFTTPTTYIAGKEFKRVVVSVDWTDAVGGPRSVKLEDAIPSIAPGDSLKIALNERTTPRKAVAIIVNPASVAGVIPIGVGNNTDTAATNPRPVIVGTGNNSTAVETRFDIYTYRALSGDTAQAQSRVETSVVGCTCTLGTGTATTQRPTYWNGFQYVTPETSTGLVPTSAGKSGVTQSALCTSCCRDHHDPATVAGALFDPRRALAAGAIEGGHHPHYLNTAGVLSAAVTASGSDYSEACRLIRVDGVFRTAAEPYDDHFGLLATAGLSDDTLPTTTIIRAVPTTGTGSVSEKYQVYVVNYLNSRFVSGTALNTELEPSGVTGYSAIQPPLANIATGYSPKYLHTRGLYIDYLEPEVQTSISNAKSNCPGTGNSPPDATQLSDCVLKFLPFTSINLTEIGDMQSGEPTDVEVSNFGLKTTINDVMPVKGRADVKNGANEGDPDVVATSRIQRTSAGLAVANQVFPDAELPARPLACTAPCLIDNIQADSQSFHIGAGQSGGSGEQFSVELDGSTVQNRNKLLATLTLGNPAEVRFDLGGSTQCNKDAVNITPFTCVPNAGQTLGSVTTLPVTIGNYNRQFSTSDGKSVANKCTAANNDTTLMPYVVKFDIVRVLLDGTTVATSPPPTNNGAVGTIAANGEYTSISAGPVANDAVFTVEFGTPVYLCPDNYTTYVNATNGNEAGGTLSSTACSTASTPTPLWSSTMTTVCGNLVP